MGCGFSAEMEKNYEKSVMGKLDKTLRRLQVSDKDCRKFFKIYAEVDPFLTGVTVEEFFQFFQIECTDFSKRAFELLDVCFVFMVSKSMLNI